MAAQPSSEPTANQSATPPEPNAGAILLRGSFGGALMGLANLVPGISGGTMLVASGIYPQFIDAIAQATRLKLTRRVLLTLAAVVVAALVAIVALAQPVKFMVIEYRWAMYSLFIGLTLAGVPLVWKLGRPHAMGTWVGLAIGLGFMIALVIVQNQQSVAAGSEGSNFVMMFLAGLAGASAMILPGVSGAYLLLILGQYLPILDAIDAMRAAVGVGDWTAVGTLGLTVILPVGVGVVTGVVVVSQVLQWCLKRLRTWTYGVLLGLLIGAVAGLWPFQRGVAPAIGDTIKGRVLTAELLAELEPKDWPTEYFTPELWQVAAAMGLILAGYAMTWSLTKISKPNEAKQES